MHHPFYPDGSRYRYWNYKNDPIAWPSADAFLPIPEPAAVDIPDATPEEEETPAFKAAAYKIEKCTLALLKRLRKGNRKRK